AERNASRSPIIRTLQNYKLENFILFMSARPFLIFFGNGDFVRFECLLKKRIMSFPALLFSLCLVTNNIRSLYASLGNSEQASDSGFSNPSKISGSSDDSNISSKSSSRLIADI